MDTRRRLGQAIAIVAIVLLGALSINQCIDQRRWDQQDTFTPTSVETAPSTGG